MHKTDASKMGFMNRSSYRKFSPFTPSNPIYTLSQQHGQLTNTALQLHPILHLTSRKKTHELDYVLDLPELVPRRVARWSRKDARSKEFLLHHHHHHHLRSNRKSAIWVHGPNQTFDPGIQPVKDGMLKAEARLCREVVGLGLVSNPMNVMTSRRKM